MTNEKRESILSKIENLFNKTTEKGCTEAEAESALLLAQKLMAKYHIGMEEIKEKEPEEVITGWTKYKAMAQWTIRLHTLIAKHFRCKAFLQNKTAVYLGEKLDVRLATELFNMVYETADRGTKKIRKQYRKEGKSTVGVADSYLHGFISGLTDALEAQKQAQVTEDVKYEIVLVTPASVLDAYSKINFNSRVSGRGLSGVSDTNAYAQGQIEGKGSVNRKIK